MPATLHDIAQRSGTSVSTVSRVLNGKGHRISQDTHRRVMEAARELGYRPNPLARGLRLQKTMSIGLVMPDIANPFFAHVTRTIQREMHAHGYSLMVCNTNEDPVLEVEHIDLLQRNQVDGLIVMPVGKETAHLEAVLDQQMPLVLFDRCFEHLSAHSVVLDNRKGGFMATDLLARHGHHRIGLVQGLVGTSTNTERLRGYRDALIQHDLPFDPALVAGDDFRERNGYAATKELLNLDNPPTALFAMGDLLALGALQALLEAQYAIPDDLSMVSFDEIDFAPVLFCPLTTIGQPREAMSKAAVNLLLEQINQTGLDEAQKIVFQPKLYERASVASPST